MAPRTTKKRNRVYEGRFKGTSETHMPNDTFRKSYDSMDWPSHVEYTCNRCRHVELVHRLELKIHRCTICGGE